jgi:DNA-binding transcriptional regulator LsrR (DeoR family)
VNTVAKIFLSSTFKDLETYRKAVVSSLRKAGHTVDAMEDFPPVDERPVEECRRRVSESDLYVGILAWRYGHMPQNSTYKSKSVTELEYWAAVDRNIECLLFLVDDNVPWVPGLMDEDEPKRRLADFKNHLRENHSVAMFNSPDNLASNVSTAIAAWDSRRELGRSLSRQYSSKTIFSIVKGDAETRRNVTSVAGHCLLSELRRRAEKKERETLVGIVGGPTTREIVARLPELIARDNNINWPALKFVSLNAAGESRSYQNSANFQVARLSEIFSYSHLASLPNFTANDKKVYVSAVDDLDIMLCSCGDRDGFLFEWLRKKAKGEKIQFTERIVGDFCLTPINAEGNSVKIQAPLSTFLSELRACPAFRNVGDLNRDHRTIILPVVSQERTYTSDERDLGGFTQKTNVVKAVLRTGVVGHCILSETMAQDLLRVAQ